MLGILSLLEVAIKIQMNELSTISINGNSYNIYSTKLRDEFRYAFSIYYHDVGTVDMTNKNTESLTINVPALEGYEFLCPISAYCGGNSRILVTLGSFTTSSVNLFIVKVQNEGTMTNLNIRVLLMFCKKNVENRCLINN